MPRAKGALHIGKLGRITAEQPMLPYAENARTHSPAQVAQIASSIAEFGFVNPVLVDGAGVLVAGHGRVMAAKHLGMASVPAIRLAHLTEPQARALRLADNQIALNSGWDEALLAAEIARIRDDASVDLDVLGFSGMELDRLLAAADTGLDGEDADEAPPLPVNPVTREGDLWRCGDQCGDRERDNCEVRLHRKVPLRVPLPSASQDRSAWMKSRASWPPG
jgi:ParB-like chromosome segregation protein Spo0J